MILLKYTGLGLIISLILAVAVHVLSSESVAGLTDSGLEESIPGELQPYITDPQVDVSAERKEALPEEASEAEKEGIGKPEFEKKEYLTSSLKKFGYDFFTGPRNRISKLEESLAKATGETPTPSVVRDAISGFVGPVDMMGSNVAATVPSKYVLGPHDRITLHFWSDLMELQTISLVVDGKGEVIIPKTGKMVVRGMTLAQFQEAVREEMARVAYKDPKLVATLDRLRSIQIFITGEAFRPGSYAVSAVTTLFNALYMCGGPNDNGSLRNIKLLRNKETKAVDFYRFLMDGDSSQDFSLDAGDTIFISQIGRTAAVSGEVTRPAVYELSEGENLLELISMAGGTRPSGFLQRVQIDSVDPNRERIVLDVDLSDPDRPNPPIFDGDTVTVFSIPSERMNTVTLEGKVRMPGVYQLKEGMKVSDLIQAAQGVLGEAYMERADLFRLNLDRKTTKLIPINLSKALAGDSGDNISLKQWDRFIVYSKWDVKWIADRVVSVHGAVQRPGSYERADGMTIDDLLIQAGGLLPDAYSDRALVLRLGERGKVTKSIPVNLKAKSKEQRATSDEQEAAGSPMPYALSSMLLEDGDTLLVYTYQEARWEPKREVTVAGAVQNPNIFERVDGMRVSDLLRRAGGVLPNAYLERADIKRFLPDHETFVTVPVDLARALSGDEEMDALLEDEDLLTVYTLREAQYKPNNIVTIYGAVQRPDAYMRTIGMKLSDLLFAAGGILPGALRDAEIARINTDGEILILTADVIALAEGDESQDVPLEDGDVVSILRQSEFPDILPTVTVEGEVRYPGSYVLKRNERLSHLIQRAGGLTDIASPEASVVARKMDYLILDEQKKDMQLVKQMIEDLNQQEYQREVAKARLIEGKKREELDVESGLEPADAVPTGDKYAPVASTIEMAGIVGQTEAAVSSIEQVTLAEYMLVTPARKIDTSLPSSNRLVLDLREAIEHPGTANDIILKDGDTIMIPPILDSISVFGAVPKPLSHVYIKGKKAKDYIKMAGGYSNDADKDAVYVVKTEGIIVKGDEVRLSPGDMIVVPTKVMVQKVTDRWGQVINVVKFAFTTLAMVYTIKLILGRM